MMLDNYHTIHEEDHQLLLVLSDSYRELARKSFVSLVIAELQIGLNITKGSIYT